MERFEEDGRALYVISVAAEIAGMHAQTLRMYERRGLLNPERTMGGSRRYSTVDIERLRRIAVHTERGMNLEGVRRVLDLEDEVERLSAELERSREEIAAMRRKYSRELVPVKHFTTPWVRRA